MLLAVLGELITIWYHTKALRWTELLGTEAPISNPSGVHLVKLEIEQLPLRTAKANGRADHRKA